MVTRRPFLRSRENEQLTGARGHLAAHVLDQGPARQGRSGHRPRMVGALHAPPLAVPAGALGLVQAHAGRRGRAPGAVGVPGQHAVLTGAVLPAEGHGGLHHARVGAGVDEASALWVQTDEDGGPEPAPAGPRHLLQPQGPATSASWWRSPSPSDLRAGVTARASAWFEQNLPTQSTRLGRDLPPHAGTTVTPRQRPREGEPTRPRQAPTGPRPRGTTSDP